MENIKKKDWVQELVRIMERLRSKDNGCPWDLEQSHETLKQYLIEECYELIDAIDGKNDTHIQSELGDVLLQVVFHCQIAKEDRRFDLQDVAKSCAQMLIRRHPHIFGDAIAHNREDVAKAWQKIKEKEKQEKTPEDSILDGIPRRLPALIEAEKIQKKVSDCGFDWPNIQGVLDKIREELQEVEEAHKNAQKEKLKEEVGDLLFAACRLASFVGDDTENLLKKASKKFSKRFRCMEKKIKQSGKVLEKQPLELLEKAWNSCKTPLS